MYYVSLIWVIKPSCPNFSDHITYDPPFRPFYLSIWVGWWFPSLLLKFVNNEIGGEKFMHAFDEVFLPEVKFADLWKPEFACAALFIWENKRLEFDKREANQNLFVWSRVWAFWSFGWLHGGLWIISNKFDEVFCLKWNLLIMKAGVWLRNFIFIKANENNLSRVWS